MNKIELLAPAGSYEALVAAVESGADAVYLGGSKFNARAFADNFNEETLEKAVKYAHIRAVKVYVTLNILINDKELDEALQYIRFLYAIGVDALILQDIALIRLVKNLLPDFELHGSTQMTVHSSDGALFFEQLGLKRIVLARELSLEEIKEIIKKTGIEVEVFAHGALCVSYSGQCYMSSLIGGRSGNRGRCAQPCRKKYSFFDRISEKTLPQQSGKHLLSTRDLNTYDRIEALLEAGVTSLKIEGRMKKPEYVSIVVKNYKAAMKQIYADIKSKPSSTAQNELKSIFNREFTEGYLFNKRNNDIVSIERPDNRGVYIGQLIKQQGNFATVKVEENYLSDGDGIEIISKNNKSIGQVLSGLKIDGKSVNKAEKGSQVVIFVKEKLSLGAAVYKTYDSELIQKARTQYFSENTFKIPLNCSLVFHLNQKPIITIWDEAGRKVTLQGSTMITEAEKVQAEAIKIKEQLLKTGDTPYYFMEINIDLEANCYIPVKEINQLRREGLALITKKRLEAWNRPIHQFDSDAVIHNFIPGRIKENACRREGAQSITASVHNLAQAEAALQAGIDQLYLFSTGFRMTRIAEIAKLVDLSIAKDTSVFYVMPSIIKDSEVMHHEFLIKMFQKPFEEKQAQDKFGVLLSNIGQKRMTERLGIKRLRANYTNNIFNGVTAGVYEQLGFEAIHLSFELTLQQIKVIAAQLNIAVEAIVYGYLPVMTTEFCPASLLSECNCCENKCNAAAIGLLDEKGKVFPVIRENNCRTQILNSDIIFMLEDMKKLSDAGIKQYRLDFYNEKPETVTEIIKLYKGIETEHIKKTMLIDQIKNNGFTKGHYFRGVE